jgi:TusA-related sulfurtransferase
MKKETKRHLYNALKARYKAQQMEAGSTLEVYLNNPVGIGEHPQIVEEMAKQLENLANAEDCIATLEGWEKHFFPEENQTD